jgi:NTE family protein
MKNHTFLFIARILVSAELLAQPVDGPTHLVFEGAGIRGIAYAGALAEMDRLGCLDRVEAVAGTSAGAITACLFSVGFSPEELGEVVGETDFGKFNDSRGGLLASGIRMNRFYGWYQGDAFLQWIESLIMKYSGCSDLTFAELRELSAIDPRFRELTVIAASINNQRVLVFSADTYPNMRIADAVRASMSVPFYFKPVIIDCHGKVVTSCPPGEYCDICVDGGVNANFPLHVFDAAGFEPGTLGFRIDSAEQIAHDKINPEMRSFEVTRFRDFVTAFYVYVLESNNRLLLTPEDWQRTILIDDAGMGPRVRRLNDAERRKLIEAGEKAVRDQLG